MDATTTIIPTAKGFRKSGRAKVGRLMEPKVFIHLSDYRPYVLETTLGPTNFLSIRTEDIDFNIPAAYVKEIEISTNDSYHTLIVTMKRGRPI